VGAGVPAPARDLFASTASPSSPNPRGSPWTCFCAAA
jgi:hypothetical protein